MELKKEETTRLILDWWRALRDEKASQLHLINQPWQKPWQSPAISQVDEELLLLSGLHDVLRIIKPSDNPWNRIELAYQLSKYRVLETGFMYADKLPDHPGTVYALDATRATVKIDYSQAMVQVLRLYLSKLELRQTAILDKSFRIIDGLQTVQACKVIGRKVKFKRLNYENALSALL